MFRFSEPPIGQKISQNAKIAAFQGSKQTLRITLANFRPGPPRAQQSACRPSAAAITRKNTESKQMRTFESRIFLPRSHRWILWNKCARPRWDYRSGQTIEAWNERSWTFASWAAAAWWTQSDQFGSWNGNTHIRDLTSRQGSQLSG